MFSVDDQPGSEPQWWPARLPADHGTVKKSGLAREPQTCRANLASGGAQGAQRAALTGRLWLNDGSCIRLRANRPKHVWSYDFVMDRTHDGKVFRMLTVIDEYARQ